MLYVLIDLSAVLVVCMYDDSCVPVKHIVNIVLYCIV